MALPLTRNTNAAPGSPVKSADINDIQDHIIALAAGLRVTHTLALPLVNGFQVDASFTVLEGTGEISKTFDVGVGVATPGTTKFLAVPFAAEPGTRITEAALHVLDKSGTGNLKLKLFRTLKTSTLPSQIGGDAIATAVGELLLSSAAVDPTPFVIAADYNYFFMIEFPNENVALSHLALTVDKP